MLGSPCSPCCGVACESAFAFLVTQTPTIVISGSVPGQEAATVVERWMNDGPVYGVNSTSQQLFDIVASRAPLPSEQYDSQGRLVMAVWYAKTPADQRARLDAINIYAARYFKGGQTADGTHTLSLDLANTSPTVNGGTITYAKATADYLVRLEIILGGPGLHNIPGISCPVRVRLSITQYAYTVGGFLVPSTSEAVGSPLEYTLTAFVPEPVTVNATPVIRWPSSSYTQIPGGLQPDGSGLYAAGVFSHWYQSDLSAQNVAIRYSPSEETYYPAGGRSVAWNRLNTLTFTEGGPSELLSDSGGVASFRMGGTLVTATGGGTGANVWRQVPSAQALRQPLSAGAISFAKGGITNQLGFVARAAAPGAASVGYVTRYIADSGLDVVLNIGHP